MGRNQRDEPILAHITDSTATNSSDQKAPVNSALVALEESYIILKA